MRAITVLPLCGIAAWTVGLGYDAVVSRLLCRDERCTCRIKRGSRLVNALECAYGPDLVDPDPASHYPYRRPQWTWRALRWLEVLFVVGLLVLFAYSIASSQRIDFSRR